MLQCSHISHSSSLPQRAGKTGETGPVGQGGLLGFLEEVDMHRLLGPFLYFSAQVLGAGCVPGAGPGARGTDLFSQVP